MLTATIQIEKCKSFDYEFETEEEAKEYLDDTLVDGMSWSDISPRWANVEIWGENGEAAFKGRVVLDEEKATWNIDINKFGDFFEHTEARKTS